MDWNDYKNFSKEEFDCKHTGKNEMRPEFMSKLQELRNRYGKPIKVSSGYRDKTHPVEVNKMTLGIHTLGLAVDIAIDRGNAYEVLKLALELGFTGIGVSQKGGSRFLHLDTFIGNDMQPRPTVWSY